LAIAGEMCYPTRGTSTENRKNRLCTSFSLRNKGLIRGMVGPMSKSEAGWDTYPNSSLQSSLYL
ncbi:MAG: hypothetical protein LKK26_08075, partial [Solobacterium sp.]|nr:hypothetical protein [Solobacterium sp.]